MLTLLLLLVPLVAAQDKNLVTGVQCGKFGDTHCKAGYSCIGNKCTESDGCRDGFCCGPDNTPCKNSCVSDQCLVLATPKPTSSGALCGCNNFNGRCQSGESCVNGRCAYVATNLPPGVLDGTSLCERDSDKVCCGTDRAACDTFAGEVCGPKNTCVKYTECPAKKPCGCNVVSNGSLQPGVEGVRCSYGESCVNGYCSPVKLPQLPAGVLDGTPGCIRGSGLCCGSSLGFCAFGNVCEKNECVAPKECPAPKPCGCNALNKLGQVPDGLRCEYTQSCINGFCTEKPLPPLPPGLADGAAFCVRGGGLCCGKNRENSCGAGFVCENNECVKAAECKAVVEPVKASCGCELGRPRALCKQGQNCANGKCVDLVVSPSDGTSTCLRFPQAGTFCCNGVACKNGNVCDDNGQCMDQCVLVADGNLMPPTVKANCGCNSDGSSTVCKEGEMCQDGKCQKLDTTEFKEVPSCARNPFTEFCCGTSNGSVKGCRRGSSCTASGECVPECPMIADGNLMPPVLPANCGCGVDGKPQDVCSTKEACTDGKCVEIDFSKYVADGAPSCIRMGSPYEFCCGGKNCKKGNTCTQNGECVEQCPVIMDGNWNPPQKPAHCGCGSSGKPLDTCSNGEACNDGKCTKIDFSKYAADGAPGCIRGDPDAFCCGLTSCKYGNVCTEAGECLELCPVILDGKPPPPPVIANYCGCEVASGKPASKCSSDEACFKNECVSVEKAREEFDLECKEDPTGATFCCDNNTCERGQVCSSGSCMDSCPLILDGTKLPPVLGPRNCGCNMDGTVVNTCENNEQCNKNECSEIDYSQFAADGAPLCIRGAEPDSFCCNGASCKYGNVCHDNECRDNCPIFADGSFPISAASVFVSMIAVVIAALATL